MQSSFQLSGALALALTLMGAPAGAAPQCNSGPPPNPGAPGPNFQGGSQQRPTPTHPSPSAPSTPRPSSPTPGGPSTPRSGTPAITPGGPVGGPTTPRRPGGMIIPMTRQATSKAILDVAWDFPVAPTAKKEAHTYVPKARALNRAEALAVIASDDKRPLIVFRECAKCRGSEKALFTRRLKNEKTKLLLNWFHCVKLPPAVADAAHPFNSLFAIGGKHWYPHVFICNADGTNQVSFDGMQPQSTLQKELVKMIKLNYHKQPKPAIQAMLRFLSQFDMLDLREKELRNAIYAETASHGEKSARNRKLAEDLQEILAKKGKAMARAKAVCDLKLEVEKTE